MNSRRLLIGVLAPFIVLPAAARADTYPRQPGIDAVHYVFRLRLTDASNEIAGETAVTLRITSSGVQQVISTSPLPIAAKA